MSVTIQVSISLPFVDGGLELLAVLLAAVARSSQSADITELAGRLEVFNV